MKKRVTSTIAFLAVALKPVVSVWAQRAVSAAAIAVDIRDIRGPIGIPYPWLAPILLSVGLAIVGAAGFAGWRWPERRRRRNQMLSAHEQAFKQLDRARALMQEGQEYPFSCAVSDALREYIERRFALKATRATTEEFLHDISSNPAPGLSGFSDLLEEFLTHCDLAKFARLRLTHDGMQTLYARAWRFVEKTKIREEKTIRSKRRSIRRAGHELEAAAASVHTCERATR